MTIKLFDEQVTITPTGHLPKVLCIDEYHFETSKDSKYICVLIDYETRTVFDIIQSRQKAYLEEYFNRFNSKELNTFVLIFMMNMHILKENTFQKQFM